MQPFINSTTTKDAAINNIASEEVNKNTTDEVVIITVINDNAAMIKNTATNSH
jgi:hypothetical protein